VRPRGQELPDELHVKFFTAAKNFTFVHRLPSCLPFGGRLSLPTGRLPKKAFRRLRQFYRRDINVSALLLAFFMFEETQ